MSQNRSSAVMQQRAEPHDSLDDFPTQPWATRALIKHVLLPNMDVFDPLTYLKRLSAWEPACNRGHMALPMKEFFGTVHCSDIHHYGWDGQEHVVDFLFADSEPDAIKSAGVNWIITNPPFRLAEQFIERAFQFRNWHGTAIIARTSFLEGVGRYQNIFERNPPSIIAQFSERVPMVKGRLTVTGSTATSYCWLVWMDGEEGTRFTWIPPCRKQLERADDYSSSVLAEAAE